MSNLLLPNYINTRNKVDTLARVETPSACLTLTRSATLAITTAGTSITWQTEIRNQSFTWATTNITIPTAGYYVINVQYNASGTVTTAYAILRVNSANVAFFSNSSINSTLHAFTVMRYFETGDIIDVRVVPATNSTITIGAEGSVSESPIFHIAQLTGSPI